MSEYQFVVEIRDTVDLAAFGYPPGSEAEIVVNPPKRFVSDWQATFEEVSKLLGSGGADAEIAAAQERGDAARYALLPVIVRRVTLVDSEGQHHDFRFANADEVRAFDQDVDYQLLDSIVAEVWTRGKERKAAGHRSFRDGGPKRNNGTAEVQHA